MHDLLKMVLTEARGMWRFRWWGVALAWLIALAGVFYVYWLPDQYRAETRISVDTQSVLGPLLEGMAVQPKPETRVRMMTNTLLSRGNLEKIARQTDLMLDANNAAQEQAVIDELRRKINISGSQETDIYQISYASSSPGRARGVVQTTLDILLEQTMGSSREDSASATAFLKKQVNQYEERLQKAEKRLAVFKRKNSELLPSREGGYYQNLSRAQNRLRQLQGQLETAESRRASLRDQVTAMQQGRMPESVTSPKLQRLDTQIQQTEKRLNDMRLKYTEKHPDIIAAKDLLKRLRQKREQAASNTQVRRRDAESNPVYQQLQISLNETKAKIASIKDNIGRQRKRIDQLQSKVDKLTGVEAKLSNLNRDYEVTRKRYQKLVDRLNTADLSGDVEKSGRQVQFRILDPPVTPQIPVGPNRVLYIGFALVFGIGMGGGLSFLLSQMTPIFMTRQSLSEITGRPVLGAVSLMRSARQERAANFATAGFIAAVTALIVTVGLSILFASTGSETFRAWLGGLAL